MKVIIEVIIHATEDVKKICNALFNLFGITYNEFTKRDLKGHFDNPIILLNISIIKNRAEYVIHKIFSGMTRSEINRIIETINDKILNSALCLRLKKQDLMNGTITLEEKNSIKVKICNTSYVSDITSSYVCMIKKIYE